MSSPSPLSFLVLGTGTSSAPPAIKCLTDPDTGCLSCRQTLLPPSDPAYAAGQQNIRRNTSGVLRIPGKDGEREKTILIDCGKTFLSGVHKWWPAKGLREIDAVLLTHAHADAILGLDDLRGWTLRGAIQKSIHVYANTRTYEEIARMFPYMADVKKATGGGDVPAFTWHVFEDDEVLDICGVRVRSLAVHHGQYFTTPPSPYLCLGFLIDSRFIYMSDVSFIPESVWSVLEEECSLPDEWRPKSAPPLPLPNGHAAGQDKAGKVGGPKPRIEAVLMDSLRMENHTSHFGVAQAVEAVRRMGAQRSYLVGMEHQPSHALWVHALSTWSATQPAPAADHAEPHRVPPAPSGLWEVRTGSPHPQKEDWEVFTANAIAYVDAWEGGRKGGVWVRPACDGMTITLPVDGNAEGVRDDVYDAC